MKGRKEENVRYSSIDAFRFILACLIVGIHNPYEMPFWITVIFKIAVPLFFMISGFFNVYDTRQKAIEKNKISIIRIGKLAIMANAFYILWGIITHIYEMPGYILWVLSPSNIIKSIVFNDTPAKVHLWFLSALVMCYVLSYLISKYEISDKIYLCIIPCLVVLTIIEWDNIIIHKDIYNIYYRNFWFFGGAYFLIGSFIRKNIDKFRIKINVIPATVLCVIAYVLALIETKIAGNNDVYTILLIPEIIIFISLINHPDFLKNSFIERWGMKYSLLIYIFHPVFIDVFVMFIYGRQIDTRIAAYIMIPVVVITMLIVLEIYKITSACVPWQR